MSVNKAILVGRLGADPELRFTSDGKPVCSFSIATSEKWIGEDGQKNEKTQWHKVICWGLLAENCDKYLVKGREVYVEGKIQNREYEDKDGITRYVIEIVALNVTFLGGAQKVETEENAA